MKQPSIPPLDTGVRNLDALLDGGLPRDSVSIFSGPPGTGKTILAQQIFHHASARERVLWFGTLSEPTAKTLRYLGSFSFFDPGKVDAGQVQLIDLGGILRADGLEDAGKLIIQHVKTFEPAIVVIDSFEVFDDLAKSREEQRKFSYELAVQLMAWETTSILVGEYAPIDLVSGRHRMVIGSGGITVIPRQEGGARRPGKSPGRAGA